MSNTDVTTHWIDIDPEHLTNTERYKLLIGSVVPRPIAFVSTLSAEGLPNLAPFSFFTGVSSSPLLICFSPMRRGSDGAKKDTLRNIEATGEFVVHVVSESIVDAMNQCAAELPADVSEFTVSGLTPIPSTKVKPFRVQEAPVHLECVTHQIVNLGDDIGSANLVIGRVVEIHVMPSAYSEGKISTAALKPVARLAGNAYARTTDIFTLERP